ncbi:MAG TPA: TolC family protein [Fibrobacteria bacterium]|nr:TolC family protein [Fibrobacteria bacterium]HOX51514.1 TolC family protein [Fibrobacteria bacterium]
MNTTRALGVVVSMVLPSVAAGQDIGWDELISSHRATHSLVAARQHSRELSQGQGHQLWEDVELRYSAKRADLRKQEVGLRISPSGFGEIGANRSLWAARRRLGEAKVDQKLSEALFERYSLALAWRYQQRQRVYHLGMESVNEDRIRVLAGRSATEDFDPEDLVEAQLKRTEYRSKAEGDLYKMAQAERKMRQYIPGAGVVRLDGPLLSPAEIAVILDGIDPSRADSFPAVRVVAGELALEQAKTDQEVASSRRWLGYLEASYTMDVDENRLEAQTQRDNIAFGCGFKIPIMDGSSQDVARRKAELAEVRMEYIDERQDVERKVSELRLSIGSMLRQIAVLDSFSQRVDAGKVFTDFAIKSGSDPLLLLKARETAIQNSWDIDYMHFEILVQYLEILDLSGKFVQEPDANHLLMRKPPVSIGRVPQGQS